ncbi:hypothetical protein [Halioxenophilus sp. WMMB6]|uniref:hypothetical protein n=1 Tax=Halioxenophilus sp. WMMB6 TaxID=3073815 RepID=UPI00295E39D1|nr:hypothetical protein [Halioxenophilus sp. WMMB6]
MKTLTKAAIFTLGLGLAAAALAKPPHMPPDSEMMEQMAEQRLEAVDSLELAPTTAEEVKALMQSHDNQMQALMEAHQKAMRELHEEYQNSLKGLLSDEEMEELEDAMRELHHRQFPRSQGFRTEPRQS